MSCRQPASRMSKMGTVANFRPPLPKIRGSTHFAEPLVLMRNFTHLSRLQRLQKLARAVVIEQRIRRLDAQEKSIAAGQRETRHIERRVIWHRQSAKPEQTKYSRQRRQKNRHLKRDDDVRGPTVQRAAANVDGVRDYRDPVLQQVAERPAHDAADQHDERQLVVMQVQRVAELLDRERRIRVQLAIALLARGASGGHQRSGAVEFGHYSVDRFVHLCASSSTFAWGSRVRTSKIEIIGSRRMKMKNRNRNSPMVPR